MCVFFRGAFQSLVTFSLVFGYICILHSDLYFDTFSHSVSRFSPQILNIPPHSASCRYHEFQTLHVLLPAAAFIPSFPEGSSHVAFVFLELMLSIVLMQCLEGGVQSINREICIPCMLDLCREMGSECKRQECLPLGLHCVLVVNRTAINLLGNERQGNISAVSSKWWAHFWLRRCLRREVRMKDHPSVISAGTVIASFPWWSVHWPLPVEVCTSPSAGLWPQLPQAHTDSESRPVKSPVLPSCWFDFWLLVTGIGPGRYILGAASIPLPTSHCSLNHDCRPTEVYFLLIFE